jgi:hypothetical protein
VVHLGGEGERQDEGETGAEDACVRHGC